MEYIVQALGWLVVSCLCLGGIFISLLSFTGAWLIALAALALVWMEPSTRNQWAIVAAFLFVCVILELVDFFAAKLGVSRRGGSPAAGWAALLGGLVGMFLGTFIPVPVFGTLIGMMAGSFFAAYWVEKRRLQHEAKAAHIAWGAVWARLTVMLVKTVAALGMTAYLIFAAIGNS